MSVRKMRIEVFDENRNRYKIAFKGRVTREKALRILDIVELLGGMRGISSKWRRNVSELSKYESSARNRETLPRGLVFVYRGPEDLQRGI